MRPENSAELAHVLDRIDQIEPTAVAAATRQIVERQGVHPAIAWLRARRRVYGGQIASAQTLAATPFNSITR